MRDVCHLPAAIRAAGKHVLVPRTAAYSPGGCWEVAGYSDFDCSKHGLRIVSENFFANTY